MEPIELKMGAKNQKFSDNEIDTSSKCLDQQCYGLYQY